MAKQQFKIKLLSWNDNTNSFKKLRNSYGLTFPVEIIINTLSRDNDGFGKDYVVNIPTAKGNQMFSLYWFNYEPLEIPTQV